MSHEVSPKAAKPAGARGERVFVKSFGCQMNVYDSQRMADLVAGGRATARPPRSRTPISSCSTPATSASARRKRSIPSSARCASSRTSAGRARAKRPARRRRLRRPGRGRAKSCAARRAVDLVVGPQNYHRLPELLRARRAARSSTPNFRSRTSSIICRRRRRRRSARAASRAFVTVQEGCDKFCSFCVVPYTRGAEISRPVAQDSGRNRAAGGAGRARGHADRPERQRLSRRRRDGGVGRWRGCSRAAAEHRRARAAALHDLPSQRHGRRADRARIATSPSSMPYLHLPVQSGSDRILRGDEPQPYARATISTSSRACARRGPTSRFSSDFIVGFPGETRGRFRGDARAGRARSASPRPSRSNIRRGPARRRPTREDQVADAVKARAARARCRRCSKASGRRSTARRSGGASTCCSKSPAATPVRSSAARPICRRCRSRRRRSADRRDAPRSRSSTSAPNSLMRAARRGGMEQER